LNVTGTGNEYYSTDVSTYPALSVGDRNKFQNDFPAFYAMGIRPTVYVDAPGLLQAGIGGASTGPFSFGQFGICNNTYGTALTGAAYGQQCVSVSADSCSNAGGCLDAIPSIKSVGDLAIKNCEGCTTNDGQICFGGDSCTASTARIKYDNDGDYGYGASAFFFNAGLVPTVNESYPLGYNDNMWYSSHISHMNTKDITPLDGELEIIGNLSTSGYPAKLGIGTVIGNSQRNMTLEELDLGIFGTYPELFMRSDGPLGNLGGIKDALIIEGNTPSLMFLKVGTGSGTMGWDAGTNGFYFDSPVAMHNGYATHYQNSNGGDTSIENYWDGATSTLTITGEPIHTNNNLTADGYIQSNSGFIGDGSQLTNLPKVSNATYSDDSDKLDGLHANEVFNTTIKVNNATFADDSNNSAHLGGLPASDYLTSNGMASETSYLYVNGSRIVTGGDLSLAWSNLTSYPASCSSGQFISGLGDTITCNIPVVTGGYYLLNESYGVRQSINSTLIPAIDSIYDLGAGLGIDEIVNVSFDSYASETYPNTNYGDSQKLYSFIDNGPDYVNVTYMGSDMYNYINITSAVLHYYVNTSCSVNGFFIKGCDLFNESTMTYNNPPSCGSWTEDHSELVGGTGWKTKTVTSYLSTGYDSIAIGYWPIGTCDTLIDSKESSNIPYFVLNYTGRAFNNVYANQYYAKNTTIIAFDSYKDSDLIKSISTSKTGSKIFELPKEVYESTRPYEHMISLNKLHGLEIGTLKELINRTEYLESENKALKEQLTNICKMNGLKGCNT
jgi:hypothetical protein